MKYILFFILLSQLYNLKSQSDSATYYYEHIKYNEAINFLNKKIKLTNYNKKGIEKVFDIYNLACAYALTNDSKKSLENLEKVFQIDSTGMSFYTDCDFYNICETDAWNSFLIKHKPHFRIEISDTLFMNLSKIAIQDQSYRKRLVFYTKKHGNNSLIVSQLWKKQDSLDKQNLELLENYLTRKINILSNFISGELFSTKCFLVIQHSNIKNQERYLPIIKSLYDTKETSGENYALLYDRVNLYKTNGKQFYGTQINTETNTPYPIINEQNVDKRREKLGMVPLKSYLLNFGINYNPK